MVSQNKLSTSEENWIFFKMYYPRFRQTPYKGQISESTIQLQGTINVYPSLADSKHHNYH